MSTGFYLACMRQTPFSPKGCATSRSRIFNFELNWLPETLLVSVYDLTQTLSVLWCRLYGTHDLFIRVAKFSSFRCKLFSPYPSPVCDLGLCLCVNTQLRAWSRVVWDQPTFIPAIHYQLPHIPFAIPWFRLRPTLKILKFEHFLSPKSCVTVDIMILSGASQSKV
jgi:hypothetical protein